ncbi:MAG TPA: hypothetical protein PKA42_01400 [Candidatus Paceibacterota bacterium]|nr:hypothetical protein [Candidatus Paceibacterota bacterium]HMO82799.1 hypothetical protein [Candidatus Paceibacterota bacterium]
MTIAQNFASKAAVAFVAVAMIFTMFAPAAQAQSTEDLQTMINTLLAQIAALQAQVGGSTGAGSTSGASFCPYTWTRDLSSGATGADVMKLQQFLNSDADTRVAASGVGSMGMETEFYGPATAAAVSKFQVKYRAEILSPNGLVNPTGYFGASSRNKANSLCSASIVTPVDPTTPTGPTTPSTPSLSGNAFLDDFTIEQADDTDLEEGQRNAPIALLTVEFGDGDAEVDQILVKLKADNSNTEKRPWNVFSELSLWVDGKKIATKSASSRSDYRGAEANGELLFTNLGLVAEEEEEVEITLAATIQNTVKGSDTGETWEVSVQSLRFADASGVVETVSDSTSFDFDSPVEFTIEEEGVNDKAKIRSNTSDPKEATLKVENDTKKSDAYTVFVFNIEVEEDSSDLDLYDAVVDIKVTNPATASTTTTVGKVIADVWLVVDGKKVKGKASSSDLSDSIAINANKTVPYTFEFKGFGLDADDLYKAEVIVEFRGQNTKADYQNGVTIQAMVDGSDWELEGLNDANVLSGTRSSKVHTLSDADADITGYTWTAPAAGNFLDFTFKVEANDEDFDVLLSSFIYATSGTATTTGPVLSVASGDASAISGGFQVDAGDTATFRIRFVLNGVNGTIFDATATSVAGQTIPTDKQVSPTVTRNVSS